jgi:hypothetical protein
MNPNDMASNEISRLLKAVSLCFLSTISEQAPVALVCSFEKQIETRGESERKSFSPEGETGEI